MFEFCFSGPNLPKNGISDLKQKNRTFVCAHGHYLLYLIFPHVGRQIRYFNVSSSRETSNLHQCTLNITGEMRGPLIQQYFQLFLAKTVDIVNLAFI